MAAAIPPFHQTDERLPFDLRTMALSLLRHWYIAALSMIFGVALGFVGAYTLGSQTWRTETVLLYKPRLENLEGDPAYEAPPITTQMNLVKIRSNLEETRHLLNLDTKLEVLGKAVEVYVQDRTDLLTISVTWETARSAADIANTLRAVFMENQQRIRRTETDKTVDQLLRQAQIDRETLNRQMTNMSLQVETLQEQVKEERKTLNYRDVQRDMDIRSTQIREAISQDQNYRSRVAELTRAELDLERAQKALERGVVSKAEYDAVKAEYDRLKALTVDTDQIKGWKSQLENLDARLAGVQDIGITPASTMLSEIRMKMFDLQLQEIALDNKIQYLQNADANDISDFTVISEAQIPSRPYRSNRRMIFMACVLLATGLGFGTMVALEMLDSTIKSLGELRIKFREPILGNVPHVKVWHQIFSGLIPLPYESRLGIEHPESSIMEPFRIIARHLRGSVPGRGARILVVSAHHGEGKSLASVYLASCMGRQDERVLVMDAFVRADVHQERFSGSSRKIGSTNTLLRQVETILMEPIRSIFGRGRGYHEGQGNSLADRLYRWAGRVSRRQPSTGGDDTRLILRDLIPDNEKNLKGLGEYLSFHADELEEITWPTVLSGVDCLPHIGKAVIPELLGSNRMKQLMETMLERYSVILIDGPPVLPYVDAELIAQQCDAVVLVVRSQWCQLGMVQKAMERLKRLNVPIAGLILNDVDALYLET